MVRSRHKTGLCSKGFVDRQHTHLWPSRCLVPGNFCFDDGLQWYEGGSEEGGKGLQKQIGIDTERVTWEFLKPRVWKSLRFRNRLACLCPG